MIGHEVAQHLDSIGHKPHGPYWELTSYGQDNEINAATELIMTVDGGNVDQLNNGGLPITAPMNCVWTRWGITFRGTGVFLGGPLDLDLSRNGVAVGSSAGFTVTASGAIESASGFIAAISGTVDTLFSKGDLIGISATYVPFFGFPTTDVEIRFTAGFFRT